MLPQCICAECAGAGPHFGRERRVRVGGAGAGDAARAAVRGGRSGSTAAYGGAALIVATVAGRRTLPVPLRVVRVRAGATAAAAAAPGAAAPGAAPGADAPAAAAATARGGARAVPAAAAAARGRRAAATTGPRERSRVAWPDRGGWSIRVFSYGAGRWWPWC